MACNYYDLYIDQNDINDAVNNTSYLDNVVYVSYYDCSGTLQTTTYGTAGYVTNAFCSDTSYGGITLYYYDSDFYNTAINSGEFISGNCGTPTPTPDVTSTPTPTPPYGCFSLTYQSSNTVTNYCGGNAYNDVTETWRISYVNGVVNQNVNVIWEYELVDPCNGTSYQTGTGTILQGNSYVDVYLNSQSKTDCPPDPTCFNLYRNMLGVISADTSCSTLATTPTPTATPAVTPTQTPTPNVTPSVTTTPTPTNNTSIWLGTSSNYGDSSTACANYATVRSFYANPGNNWGLVSYFTKFYEDGTLTTVVNGGGRWYGMTRQGDPNNIYAVQIDTDGYVMNYTSCPTPTPQPTQTRTPNATPAVTPTQTVTKTQTPTATPYTQYTSATTCNTLIDSDAWGGSGGRGTYTVTIDVGNGTGNLTLTYNAISIPDQFQVFWNGNTVIDTGFRGSSSYNAQLNALGYPNVSGPGSGSASFTKTSQSPGTITIVVTAPLSGTEWSATLSCPSDPTPTPTSTPAATPTTTTTLTATPTQTPTTTTTLTRTPTQTPTTTTTLTATPTQTPTTTTTLTRTPTQTPTTTTTLTRTPTQTPTTTTTLTATPTQTQTPTTTTTLTATPTQTPTTTTTLTATPTQTPTRTASQTPTTTTTLTATPTQTPTTTTTLTATPTQTPTTTTTLTATPTQTPTTTTTLTATPTRTPSQTPTRTASQTPTTTTTLTATPTQTPTTTTTLTATPTQTPTTTTTLTATPTQTPTTTTTLTATPTQTPTSQLTPTPTNTPTQTNTPSNSPTPSITSSPTNTPTQTNTPSNSATPQVTTTPTQTPTTTTTLTATPTQTNTPSNSATPQVTTTQTSTPTQTNTPSNSPTPQVTATQTSTPTQTNTPSNSATPQVTNTQTPTDTPISTSTPTPSPTATTTLTATPSQTPTLTMTPTNTPTFTITPTQTPTPTPTNLPIDFAANGFFYEPSTGNLYATTDETIRMTFIGATVGANFLNPAQVIFTAAIADRGLKFIGLVSGNSSYSLASDLNGVVYKVSVPAASITQTSFESATGGTVSNNTISFSGNDVTTTVTIPDVYTNNGTLTGNRIVSVGPYSLTFGGSGASVFKVVDTTGNPIETGSSSGINFYVDYQGGIYATSKSFWITNPHKEGFKLRHGSLEGPENGVYYRGKSSSNKIDIPSDWIWLVDFDSITVSLTSVCGDELYVHSITDLYIEVRGVTCEYFYVVNGERKDVDDLKIDLIG